MGILAVLLAAGQYILKQALEWMYILLAFLVFDLLFRTFVPASFLDGLSAFIIYMENAALFKMIPEVGIVWILNVFAFIISLEILWLAIGRHNKPVPHHSDAKK